jgi:xylulokinase
LLLTGGGAKGAVWRDTVQRLSGRAIRIPDTGEAVAVGAAVQAAAIATGEEFAVIQQRWGLGQGRDVDAVEADTETLERHRSVRERTQELNNPASDG